MRSVLSPLVATALLILPVPAMAADDACTIAARRILIVLREEAKGTRHEAQIENSIAENGEAPVVKQLASGLQSEQCTILIAAPESTIRSMAITMLPERNGQ